MTATGHRDAAPAEEGAARRAGVIPCVLSIAGSDSGGGAGIQADLKAFAACGVHGMTAITAITAQNTREVSAVEAVSPEMIIAQVRAVARDIGIDAIKIGMLGTVATIVAVATALNELPSDIPIVLDPVMVSESGAQLLEPDARRMLVEALLWRVTVVTPNVPEARALMEVAGAGTPERSPSAAGQRPAPEDPDTPSEWADMVDLVHGIHALGPHAVVVTGGHRPVVTDVFYDGTLLAPIEGERYAGGAAHGSGCTHSSVLAARLAWGDTPYEAAIVAKRRASDAVRDGLTSVGAGAGPVNILGVT
jgi:hydroxymethylpyrimidine/phosphomethylpyrimidine kinase